MTSPIMVDIPRSKNAVPMDVDKGFPFDDEDFSRGRGDHSFRTQLDDIVKEHPELAEHLNFGNGFPFNRSSFSTRNRRGSDEHPTSSDPFKEHRRFNTHRPFRSNFDDFGFNNPTSTFYRQSPPTQQTSYRESPTHAPTEEPQVPPPQTQEETVQKPPQVPQSERGRKPTNIQQSNTVDLGQKQEPVNESRNQRSMSAPPDNRTNQRFVSSINIPVGGNPDMGIRQSQEQQPQQQSTQKPNMSSTGKATERVIPIHVEGRDEPVIPKNVHQTFSQPPPQQQQQQPHFQERDRGFGSHPSNFQHFYEQPHGFRNSEEFFKPHFAQQHPSYQQQYQNQYQSQPQYAQQPQYQNQQFQGQAPQGYQQYQGTPPPQHPQQQAHQQHQAHPQQQQAHPQQFQAPQQPKPQEQQQQPQPPQDQMSKSLTQIQAIQKDVLELMTQVENFDGKPRDKQYLYLDEMLTRNMLKLDNIETEGKDVIRQARKQAISCIEKCIGVLEAKANANVGIAPPAPEKMETEIKESSPKPEGDAPIKEHSPPATLEVSGVSRSGTVTSVVSDKNEETPMEIAPSPSASDITKAPETNLETSGDDAASDNKDSADCTPPMDGQGDAPEDKKEKKTKSKKKEKEAK